MATAYREYTAYLRFTIGATTYAWASKAGTRNSVSYLGNLARFPTPTDSMQDSFGIVEADRFTVEVSDPSGAYLSLTSTLAGVEATLELVTRRVLTVGSPTETVNTRKVTVESVTRLPGALSLELADLDRLRLDAEYPSRRFTVSNFPDLYVDHVGRPVPVVVGTALKVPFAYIADNSGNGPWVYAGPQKLGTETVLTVYSDGRIVDPVEYTVSSTTVGGATYMTVSFTREQVDFQGSILPITADVQGSISRDAGAELHRIMTAAGLTPEFAAGSTFNTGNRMYVDTAYIQPRTFQAIIEDLLLVLRGHLYRTSTGGWQLVQDRDSESSFILNESAGDLIEISGYTRPRRAQTVELEYYQNDAASPLDLKHVISKSGGGASGKARYVAPYLRDHEGADRLLDYLAKREQNAATATAVIHDVQIILGEVVTLANPLLWTGNKSFICQRITRSEDRNEVELREYVASIYTYTPGTLPSDAVRGYSPDYSLTFPDPPAGFAIDDTKAVRADDGSLSAWVRLSATKPAENATSVVFAVRNDGTGEIYTGFSEEKANNLWKATIPGLKTNTAYTALAWAVSPFGLAGEAVTAAFTSGLWTSAPPAPSSIVVTQGPGKSVRVSWANVGISNLNYYNLQRDNVTITRAKTTEHVDQDSALVYGSAYVYRVRVHDTVGNISEWTTAIPFVLQSNVSSPDIVPGAIQTTHINNLVITAEKIASGAIDLGADKIYGLLKTANLEVISDPTKIADSLIGNEKLASLAVTAGKIADGAVNLGGSKIAGLLENANLRVITDPTRIANSLIGNEKLANLAVTAGKIADGSIDLGGTKIMGLLKDFNMDVISDPTKIADSLIGNTKLANLSVTANKIASGAIDLGSDKILGLLKNANMEVISDPTKIADALIGNAHLANTAITAGKIADGSIDLGGAKVTGLLANARLSPITDSTKIADSLIGKSHLAGAVGNLLELQIAAGINVGAVGNIQFVKNQNATGVSDPGKIRLLPGRIFLPDGSELSFAGDNFINTYYVNNPPPGNTFYLVCGVDTATSRFGSGVGFQNHRIFPAFYKADTRQWFAHSSNNTQVSFTPLASDTIAAIGVKYTTGGSTGIDTLNSLITPFLLNSTNVNNYVANQAIGTAQIGNAAIGSAQIAAAAIDTANIKTAAITSALIANAAVGSAQIADASITEAKVGTAAIGTAAIKTAAITNALIANAAVGSAQIATAAIDTVHVKDAAIGTAAIKTGAITTALIANAAVGSAQIATAAITEAKIGAAAVGTAAIKVGAIETALIANAAIGSAQIAAAAIDTVHVKDAAIGTAAIKVGAIGTALIANAAVGSAQIAAAAIDTVHVKDAAIGNAAIANLAVTNEKVGGILQSSQIMSGRPRWKIDKNGAAEFTGITIYDTDGNLVFSSGGSVSAVDWNSITGRPPNEQLLNQLLNPSTWDLGSTGSQPGFNAVHNISNYNSIVEATGPQGLPVSLWRCIGGTQDAQGGNAGFVTDTFTVNPAKKYRFSIWMYKAGSLTDGTAYFGCLADTVRRRANGTIDSNPYFWTGDLPALTKWYLLVGYIFPASATTSVTVAGGIYDATTGQKVSDADFDFVWKDFNQTSCVLRSFLYFSTNTTTRLWLFNPRVDVVDGTEQPIESIIAGTGILNNNVSISSNGLLVGAGGGQVTLPGLGAGAFATLNQITNGNVSTYIASAAIGGAYIGAAAIGEAHIGTAAVTNAKIGGIIQSSVTQAGRPRWKIDKNGAAEFTGITIYDSSGNVVLSSGETSAAIKNANIVLNSDGSLVGAGGGQVTAGGLGAVRTDLANAPGSILNSSISLTTSGSLSGGGGGQVTLPGLGAGPFATLGQLNSGNISTYIATAAIGGAYIGAAAIGTAHIGNAQITTAKIGTAQIDTLRIAGNAVTIPTNAYTDGSISLTQGSWITIQSVSMTNTGSDVFVFFSCIFSITPVEASFRVLRDGVTVGDFAVVTDTNNHSRAFSFSFKTTPVAGTATFTAQMLQSSVSNPLGSVSKRSLLLLETKR